MRPRCPDGDGWPDVSCERHHTGASHEERAMPELTTPADRRTAETRTLLACGVVAGPLFLAGEPRSGLHTRGLRPRPPPDQPPELGRSGLASGHQLRRDRRALCCLRGRTASRSAAGVRRNLGPTPRRCTWGRPRLRRPVRHRCRSRLSAGSTRWGARPDQLARAAARGRLHGRRFQHDRRLPRIRAAFRGAQAAGLDRGVLAPRWSFWASASGRTSTA